MKRVSAVGAASSSIKANARYAQVVTHSICSTCTARVEEEIATVERLRLGNAIAFPCPACPCEGAPYKLRAHGEQRRLYIRYAGCGLTWITDSPVST